MSTNHQGDPSTSTTLEQESLFRLFGRLWRRRDEGPSHAAARAALVGLFASGAALILLAVAYEGHARVVAILWSLASAAVGLAFGFLFAVPHARSRPNAAGAEDGGDGPGAGPIAQIAQWLTNMIIGVGLVEARSLLEQLRRLADFVGDGMGSGVHNRATALALIVAFAIVGFFAGHLVTRLQLNRALGDADRLVNEERKLRQDAARQLPDTTGRGLGAADAIRPIAARLARRGAEPETVRNVLTRLASDYERVRASTAAGRARIDRLDRLVAEMRTFASAGAAFRGDLMQSSSPGERLVAVAFLAVNPDAVCLQWLADRFAVERPFVQYHAAVALRSAAEHLRRAELNLVQDAIEHSLAQVAKGPADVPRDENLAEAKARVQARMSEKEAPG